MEVQTVTEQALFATMRIETDTPDGVGTGTAFSFGYAHDGREWGFMVTNKHVIAGATTGRFFFTRGEGDRPLVGERYDFEISDFAALWHGHPDADVDITVAPMGGLIHYMGSRSMRPFFRSIPSNYVPTEEEVRDMDAVEDVMFVGYPNGIFDTKNLMPIVRRGITATPFQIDYEGEPKFLIDASVFPGSSGSPVFLFDSGGYMSRTGTYNLGVSRVMFLGVISAVAIAEQRGRIDFAPIPTQQTPIVRMDQMLNLGIVFKASTVVEAARDLLRTRGEL